MDFHNEIHPQGPDKPGRKDIARVEKTAAILEDQKKRPDQKKGPPHDPYRKKPDPDDLKGVSHIIEFKDLTRPLADIGHEFHPGPGFRQGLAHLDDLDGMGRRRRKSGEGQVDNGLGRPNRVRQGPCPKSLGYAERCIPSLDFGWFGGRSGTSLCRALRPPAGSSLSRRRLRR